MDILVGSTGFVGGNLRLSHSFSQEFHSTDIAQAFGLRPELCVYAGVRSEKYLANRNPEQDYARMEEALRNLCTIAPKKLVLISTVDVLRETEGMDETAETGAEGLQPYGANRLWLEQRCREEFPDCTVVRLPGLFGQGLKKNLLYDLLEVIPFMLTPQLFERLSAQSPVLQQHYSQQENGFYRCTCTQPEQREALRDVFRCIGFTAASFTDSRSVFQFYDLSLLWQHIQRAVENQLPLLHLATEPVSASQAALALTGDPFVNHLDKPPLHYDFRTRYAALFGGGNGYLQTAVQVLDALCRFGAQYRRR